MAQNDTAIVFGGSGFLGSHVADALSERGFSVRIFDRTPSPYLRSDQEMIVGDIRDGDAVIAATKGCSYVYNFAAVADIEQAHAHPRETMSTNTIGVLNTLDAARLNNAKRYIFASSIYVFSNTGSFYRASKQAAEIFIESYHESFQLPFTILRYGSLYGRRAGATNNIARMVREALEKGTISYEGPQDAVREYIHASDAARLSVQILSSEFINRHVVLTGHERFHIHEIMKMISEMLPNKDIEIRFFPGSSKAHYSLTPYTFQPKIGHKLTSNEFVDLGQGILDCLTEVHESIEEKKVNYEQ